MSCKMETFSPSEKLKNEDISILGLVSPSFDDITKEDTGLLVHLKQSRLKGSSQLSYIAGIVAGLILDSSAFSNRYEILAYLKTVYQHDIDQKKLNEMLLSPRSSITYINQMGVVGLSQVAKNGFIVGDNYEDCICIAMTSQAKPAFAQIHISPRIFAKNIAPVEFSNLHMHDERLDVQLAVHLHHILHPEIYTDMTLVDRALEQAHTDTAFLAELYREISQNPNLQEVEFSTIGGNPESQRHINRLLKHGGSMKLKQTKDVQNIPPLADKSQLRSFNYRYPEGHSITKEIYTGAQGIFVREQNDPRHRIFSFPNSVTAINSLKEANPFSDFVPLS